MIKNFLRVTVLSSILTFCSCDTVTQNTSAKIEAGTYSGQVSCDEGRDFSKTVEIHGSGRPLYDGQIARQGLKTNSPLESKAAQVQDFEVIQLDVAPIEPFETSCVIDHISQGTGNLNRPSAEFHVAHNFREGYFAGRIEESFTQTSDTNLLEYGINFTTFDFASTSGVISANSGYCSGTLFKQN